MIERLSAATVADVERVGGKAAGLVRLLEAGVPVPEAWVVPAEVSHSELLRRVCDKQLRAWWKEARAEYPGSIWAVRSSAVAEDMAEASFAGVYETVLGVSSLAALREAVRACWVAHEAGRAEVYRAAKQVSGSGGIAVVLQRMLHPTVSGVLLTSNPRRPFADELVIDASWGLGEAIVSGKVDPDHIVLTRSTGGVRRTRVGSKSVETTYAGRLQDVEVDEARRAVLCLSETQIASLHELARAVISGIGPGRDLEWAFEGETPYLLQDRPITGLPSADPVNVWSRRWGDEYLSEYALPLPSDLTSHWLAEPMFKEMISLQGRTDLAALEPLRRFNGYTYMSGEYVAAIGRAFPKSMRQGSLGQWFTPLWHERIDQEAWNPLLGIGMALAPLRDPSRGPIWANVKALERHCAAIDAAIVPKLRQDYRGLSPVEWRRQLNEVDRFGLEHFRVIRWGMGMYNTVLHRVLSELLAAGAEDDGELYHALISGLPDTRTAELNREIWGLGMTARDDGDLCDRLSAGATYAELRQALPAAALWRRFDAFVEAHGHRSSSRDISRPRWRETPDVLLGFVRAQLQSPKPPEDPRRSEARAAEARTAALDEALRRVGGGPFGLARKHVLRWVCTQTQTFTAYRENQRYHLDYLLAHLRHLALEQGRRLVVNGHLEERDDVFLLTLDELERGIRGEREPFDPAALEERRAHHLTHRDRLPATFLFDDVETEGELAEGDPTGDEDVAGITGLGASRGVARGPSRVIASLDRLSDVQPGDVLVVSNIDPGWTSVFPLLAALVTETGGVLSHGAILAREYGIPTVTGVPDATTLLPTGTEIAVDGNRGVVELVEIAHAA